MNMKLARLVLFFGVLAIGILTGFSIGYDHGMRAAESRARTASARFYHDFKAKVAEGNIFALCGVKIMPMSRKQAKICGNKGYLASAKTPGKRL
ncbi:MAG: hypothetical protein M0Z75_04275 [Nitrospiraceae bacterium]|nr:hypothetical protein [Nitrospiraceae bacterium]